jgi:hypothetical protein
LAVFVIHPFLAEAISMEQGKASQERNDPIWGSHQKSNLDFPRVARQVESYDDYLEDFPSADPDSPGVTKEKLKNALTQVNLSKQQKRQVKEVMKQAKEEAKTSGKKGRDPQKIIDQIRGILNVEQRREFDRLLIAP